MSELQYIPFEEESDQIKSRVTGYWTKRADSFLIKKKHELSSPKAAKWLEEITAQFRYLKTESGDQPRILDIGCGTGFFPVLLGRSGFEITGIDLTSEMVRRASGQVEENAPYPKTVRILQMDAEKLSFEEESFDVILSRNLTWTLPHPIEAYREWYRVLKEGGILLNFDAEYAKGAHTLDTGENFAHQGLSSEMIEECHEIYHMLTISTLDRPAWDKEVLEQIGFHLVRTDRAFGDRMYSEKDEFYMPDRMFMITASK